MADIGTIRNALAAQITARTGLRTLAEPKDQISPPVAIIMEGQPAAVYGVTTDGAFTVNLQILVAISDAAPTEKTQRALDSYLGIGGVTGSIAAAIQADPTLGGAVHYAVPISAGRPSRIEYAGIIFFGGRVNVEVGAI